MMRAHQTPKGHLWEMFIGRNLGGGGAYPHILKCHINVHLCMFLTLLTCLNISNLQKLKLRLWPGWQPIIAGHTLVHPSLSCSYLFLLSLPSLSLPLSPTVPSLSHVPSLHPPHPLAGRASGRGRRSRRRRGRRRRRRRRSRRRRTAESDERRNKASWTF